MPFVALSYMWPTTVPGSKDRNSANRSSDGSDSSNAQLTRGNASYFESPGSLTEEALPGIIWHAISLCRDLGNQYLWIDRLCIVQDDAGSKSAQIGAMDVIYRSASFTMAVAVQSRTISGLPGYGNTPRVFRSSIFRPPLAYNYEGGCTPNGVKSIVNPSTWNHRGWTFQERILSKRVLYITEYQALFECSSATAEEELSWVSRCPRLSSDFGASRNGNIESLFPKSPGELGIRPRDDMYASDDYLGDPDSPTIGKYSRWVEDYTSRQLSFGTDILAAFSGVANAIGAGFGCHMLFGLPERFLPQSLLWTASPFALARRGDLYNIPSWSWASCSAPAKYSWAGKFLFCSMVQYHYQDPHGGLRALQTDYLWMNQTVRELVMKATRLPPIEQEKAWPGEPQAYMRWRSCVHNPWEIALRTVHDPEAVTLAATLAGSLVFNTTVASLYIRSVDISAMPSKNPGPRITSLENSAGERVGSLPEMGDEWMRPREISEGDRKSYEFVVLCAGLPSGARRWAKRDCFMNLPRTGDPYEEYWRLYVMLVERLPCKPFVARRVEIGWVRMAMWNKCDPRWETVVLC